MTSHPYLALHGAIVTILMLFLITSFVGGVLMFILMTSPKYRSRSYPVYFLCVMVSDFFSLLLYGLADIDDWFVMSNGHSYFYRHMESCLLLEHLATVLSMCSSWFMVAATVDRFLSVFYPQFSSRWCRRPRAYIISLAITLVCIAVALISILANITNMIAMYKRHTGECFAEETTFTQGYYIFLVLFMTLIIPIGIIIPLAIMTIAKLKRGGPFAEFEPIVHHEDDEDHIKRSSYALAIIGVIIAVSLTPVSLSEFAELIMGGMDSNFKGFTGGEDAMWKVFNLIGKIPYMCKFYVLIIVSRMYRYDFMCVFRRGPQPEILKEETGAEMRSVVEAPRDGEVRNSVDLQLRSGPKLDLTNDVIEDDGGDEYEVEMITDGEERGESKVEEVRETVEKGEITEEEVIPESSVPLGM